MYLKIDDNKFLVKDNKIYKNKILFNIYYNCSTSRLINFNESDIQGVENNYIFISEEVNKNDEVIKFFENDFTRPNKKSEIIKSIYLFSFYFLKIKRFDLLDKMLNSLEDIYLKKLFKNKEYIMLEKNLMESFENPSSRIKEGTNHKIKHNLSLIDLIHELVKDPEFKVYYSSKKIEDFEIDENKPCEVIGLNWNSDLLNFSLKIKLNGTVKLPVGYEKFDLEEKFETFIYRNFSIIKNGKLCLEKITFIAGKSYLETLEKLDLIKCFGSENKFEINLKKIEILNNSIDKNIDVFAKNLINLNKKEALLKVLKENVKDKIILDDNSEKNEFLKSVGITKNGFFKKIENKEENLIEVTEFKTYPKGISSFPKISEVKNKNKENKILTPRELMIQEAIEKCELSEDVKLFEETKKEIEELEKYINSVKISCLKTGSWVDGSSLNNLKKEIPVDGYCLVLEVTNKKIKV